MSSFQVYVPARSGASPQILRDVGLGLLLDDRLGPTVIDANHFTPDHSYGVVFYWYDPANPHEMPKHLGCAQHDQQWHPAKARGELAAGRFWLGKDVGIPVTPSGLLRHDHLGGLSVPLADRQEWMIPVAKRLPRKYELGEDGLPRMSVKTQYQAFYAAAERHYQLMLAQPLDRDFSIEGGWQLAEMALAYNYRINSDVIDWLELLDDLSMLGLIGATFERNILMEIEEQKKKA